MSKQYGDLEMVNGRILNLRVESLAELPDFDADDNGRLVFVDDTLYVNNGVEYMVIQYSSNSSTPLLDSLGDWFNEDLSFNPVPFNDELGNVSGLSSTDSLFDVIAQLDAAITANAASALSENDDVAFEDLEAGDVMAYDGTKFVNYTATDLFRNFADVRFQDLSDFSKISAYVEKDMVIYSEAAGKFVNKKWYYVHDSIINSKTHVITHNLGQRYCMVNVIDKNTNLAISPNTYTVAYHNTNRLVVTLLTAASIVANVIGVTADS